MNTLLILAYNEESNIEETIALSEKHFDKIIVVNDKSKDNTKSIIEQLSEKNKKITLINNQKNYGPEKSMEIGIKEALRIGSEIIIKIDER